MIYRGKTECPFVVSPFNECYVTSMSSQDIESMIYYCGENYEECDTYRKHKSMLPLPGTDGNISAGESTGHFQPYRPHLGNGTADLP